MTTPAVICYYNHTIKTERHKRKGVVNMEKAKSTTTKRVLTGADLARFYSLQKRAWFARAETNAVNNQFDEMGLTFDIMGKPLNFTIKQ